MGRATSYTGNYSAFLVEREVRREAQQRAFENQQHLIAKTEEFIRRNLAGQKTKQAKSRRTLLAKLDRVEAVRADQSSGDFRLQTIERAGTQVLTVTEASVGYPGKLLARDITFTLRRGECLGIIGPNGSGKTTFVKTVLGKLPTLTGEMRWGTKVQVGYYAQQLDDLDDRNEIIMELRRVAASTATAGELRSFLAKFLFTGDDVYKHVRDLSGGEKGRLALAKLIYSRVNVLILDEPTNHLDIPSRESLEEALDAYQGTIITISHDRYFLDRVATQILALDGVGGAIHYDGDYTEYHDWMAAERRSPTQATLTNAAPLLKNNQHSEDKRAESDEERAVTSTTSQQSASPKAKGAKPQKTNGANGREVKIVKRQGGKKEPVRDAQVIETEISAAEKQLAALSDQLSQPDLARDQQRLQKLNGEYQQADARLRSLYEEWDRVAEGSNV
jgi:ATP-binding cassette subfamily F protein 3